MRFLPVGLDVRGRVCVVAGGGQVGSRKVLNLVRAGATVTLVSPDATDELSSLAQKGTIQWLREEFEEAHLSGAFLAVAATADKELNALLVGWARPRGILVCDASSSRRSQVIFGALHSGVLGEGGHATVAVFTDGEAPSRARRIRDRIAAYLTREPKGWEESPSPHLPRGGGSESRLILVAHGSRDPRWRGSLEELLASVRTSKGGEETQMAYLQFSNPTLSEIVAEGVALGVIRYRILPLFMASAGHVEKDVLPLVQELEGRYPQISLEVLTPIGEDAVFRQLVRDIVTRT